MMEKQPQSWHFCRLDEVGEVGQVGRSGSPWALEALLIPGSLAKAATAFPALRRVMPAST